MTSFKGFMRIFPLFILEFLARTFGADGKVNINNKSWIVYGLTNDTALVISEEKYKKILEKKNKKEEEIKIRNYWKNRDKISDALLESPELKEEFFREREDKY